MRQVAKFNFSNFKQLELYMEKKIIQTLDKCADLAMDRLTQNIIDSVYDWQPKQYERTYQLLESVSRTEVKKIYDRYVVEIYFDYKKMQPIIVENKWNKHADFYGNWIQNEQSASDLINWLEYGTENKWFSHDEHRFYRDTLEWIQKEYRKIFKAYAKQSGAPIE